MGYRTRATTAILVPGARFRRHGLHKLFGDVDLDGEVSSVLFDEVCVRWSHKGIPCTAEPLRTTVHALWNDVEQGAVWCDDQVNQKLYNLARFERDTRPAGLHPQFTVAAMRALLDCKAVLQEICWLDVCCVGAGFGRGSAIAADQDTAWDVAVREFMPGIMREGVVYSSGLREIQKIVDIWQQQCQEPLEPQVPPEEEEEPEHNFVVCVSPGALTIVPVLPSDATVIVCRGDRLRVTHRSGDYVVGGGNKRALVEYLGYRVHLR